MHCSALPCQMPQIVPTPDPCLPHSLCCRLDLYHCSTTDATSAVSMLEQLPRLRGIKLGIHAYTGTEMTCMADSVAYGAAYLGPTHLPALAGLSALTELELAGEACLPPDWCHLSNLQLLRVVRRPEAAWQLLPWGEALTALTALACLEVDRRVLPGGEEGHGTGGDECTHCMLAATDASGHCMLAVAVCGWHA